MNLNKQLLAVVLLFSTLQSDGQNMNLSSAMLFEGEPFIAQHPSNPNHLVVTWMGFVFNSGTGLSIKTKVTFDGGLTWSNTVALPHEDENYAAADPSLAIASNGDVLLCYIDHGENPYGGGVYVRKSTDGGLTWGDAILAVDIFADGEEYPIDRPWFAMSANGQYVYLTTMPPSFVPAPNRPYLFQSNDGGSTWSNFEYVDGPGGLVGSLVGRPMAAPAMGENYAYTLYPSYVFSQNPLPTMLLSRQAIGSDQREYFTALAANSTSEPGSAKMGYKLLVDPSDENHITAAFIVGEGSDLDVKVIDTYDGGATWTDPVRVNDDPVGNDRMQDLVWADYDADGDLCVAWRDRRNADAPGYEQSTEIYAAYRASGSAIFSANFALTTGSTEHQAVLEQNGNDFMSLAFHADTLHAVWGSTIDGSLDIWYARRAIEDVINHVPVLIHSESKQFNAYASGAQICVETYHNKMLSAVELRSVDGRLVHSCQPLQSKVEMPKGGVSSGTMIVAVCIDGTWYSQKLIVR
ncbi:MAG: hypothetical protein RLZZ262_2445 [Bacteroidota bacterium]|jgi:hypothetical protein